VIEAAQAAFLVARQHQRGAAMRTELLDEADGALGIAEGDETLAEKTDAHRRAAGLGDLLRERRRDPVAAKEASERHVGVDMRDERVLFLRQHESLAAGLFALYN
jgi:hypothetical protein